MGSSHEYMELLFEDFDEDFLKKNTMSLEHRVGLFAKCLRNETIDTSLIEPINMGRFIVFQEICQKLKIPNDTIETIVERLLAQYQE